MPFFYKFRYQFEIFIKSGTNTQSQIVWVLIRQYDPSWGTNWLFFLGTPKQNNLVERKHRHILIVAWALRFEAHHPIDFSGECILSAGYLTNRTLKFVTGGITLYEKIHNKDLSYDHLMVFRSLCYAHRQSTRGDKFAPCRNICVFMGYLYGKIW